MKTSEHVVIQNPEALIWDFDRTILNSEEQTERLTARLALEFGHPRPDRQVMRANYHGSLDDTLTAVLGRVSMPEQRRRLDRFKELQESEYENPARLLFPDAVDLAQRAAARGLTQIIVTNRMHEGNGKASPRSIVERTVLRDWITHIICHEDGEHHKPDPRVMGRSLSDRGINPANTFVVGDQLRADGRLAMALGGHGIMVCRDGDELMDVDAMPDEWQDHITVVESLSQVHFDFATIPQQSGGGVWRRTGAPSRVPSQRSQQNRLQASEA